MSRMFFLGLASIGLALSTSACGGSSSETPMPLPPHPLNEPYRVRGAVQTRDGAPASAASEPSEVDGSPSPAGSKPSGSTWGSRPEPLPELSPK